MSLHNPLPVDQIVELNKLYNTNNVDTYQNPMHIVQHVHHHPRFSLRYMSTVTLTFLALSSGDVLI